ncbi:MAG: hypothetical protein SFV19_18815 [Rhodospirillaceae bacterium]|nr:hypothetical protein [Rhodospirillaceae bacterium]
MTVALPATLTHATFADPVKVSGFAGAAPVAADLSACFAEFLRRVIPTSRAYGFARGTGAQVAADLRAELYRNAPIDVAETDHIVVGSVGKRTAISPLATVDVLYAMPPKLGITKAGDALKTAWAVLKARNEDARIADDHTGVLVARNGLMVKVLPCLPHDGAFRVPGLATLERAAGWSVTNPIAEAATLRLMDSLYGSRPRLMLAALKSWRIHSEVPIGSFALELLVQDFYASKPRPFPLAPALVEFWTWARTRTPATIKPPGASTLLEIGEAWHGKAKGAYWRVTLADYHVQQNKIVDAALEWRQTLGPLFPIPGDRSLALPLFPERRKRPRKRAS